MSDAERDERAILGAFGWTPETAPIGRLAEAYRGLSDGINQAELAGAATGTLDQGGTLEGRAAWALIYGARTRQIARRLLEAFPPGPGPVVEVGAGFGPFGLEAGRVGMGPIALVELSSARLKDAARAFEAHGQPKPQTTVGDGFRMTFPGAGAIALPFVLGEVLRSKAHTEPQIDQRLLAWAADLAPGGKLFIIEPGTSTSARRLQALRDRLQGLAPILGPCPKVPGCPRLGVPEDWCHFTWKADLGPIARRVADVAERRWQEVHFSFLVIGGVDAVPEPTPARLLEIRALGKAKLEARLCTPSGEVHWTVLDRHAAAAAHLQSLVPGAVVAPDPGAFEAKGDGLRFQSPEAFLQVRPL